MRIFPFRGQGDGVRAGIKRGSHGDWANHVVVALAGGAHWLSEQANRLGIGTSNNAVDIARGGGPHPVMDHSPDLYEQSLYTSDTFENRQEPCMNPGGVVSEERYEEDRR